jgi:hypothetical protein
MKVIHAAGVGLLIGALFPVSAVAQSGPANAPAALQMVTKGVFTLREGQSMDLTDRGILLNLRRVPGNPGEQPEGAAYTINGQGGGNSRLGSRLDLKKYRASEAFLKDVRVCVLDLVSAAKPVGGSGSATFRLMCE